MAGYIFKPNTRKGPVFLAPNQASAPKVTLADGTTFNMVRGDQIGGVFQGHEGYQWGVPSEYRQQYLQGKGVRVDYGGETATLGYGGQRYEGSNFSSLAQSNKGMGGFSAGGGGGGYDANGNYVPGGAMGGGSTDATAFPFYNTGYPTWPNVSWPGITTAPYTQEDPIEFGKRFGEFNRGEMEKNFGLAQDFSLRTLETELQGLRNFVPAVGALSREQTSIDNTFNSAQRRRAVEENLPEAASTFRNARTDIAAQRERARAYSEGRLPDSFQDRQLELGLRSGAADRAGFSGFGARSQTAEKVSDLMSAESRFQIGQYGENLTGQNINQSLNTLTTEANLMLPPTAYSNVGSQIRPMPEVGAGRLTTGYSQQLDAQTMLQPGQALQATVQQNQFATQIEQRTRELNAQGVFSADQINAAGNFGAALGSFQYDVAYLASLQGANQSVLNNWLAAGKQASQNESFNSGVQQAGVADTLTSIGNSIAATAGAWNGTNAATNSGGTTGGTTTTSGPTTQAPSGTATQTAPATQLQQTQITPTQGPAPLTSPGVSTAVDSSSPGMVKYSGDVAPAGYTPVIQNRDGSTSAVPTAQYENAMKTFAANHNFDSGSITIENAAQADRRLSDTAGLAYNPGPSLQPVTATTGGTQVYSLPQYAGNGNAVAGAQSIANLAAMTTSLGMDDEETLETMNVMGEISSSPEVMALLDKLYAEEGPAAVSRAIQSLVEERLEKGGSNGKSERRAA